eukprot:TRINITY_DN7650_c0_g1_i1.p1 TRINITY_DN7650_c0_g1~~TRINITY_DN7650_c0_g1_i1.p1  ORF type:complete len:790 (+),score=114.30 TRINITY_DN7650_c0_g1_i1:31-2400(+)
MDFEIYLTPFKVSLLILIKQYIQETTLNPTSRYKLGAYILNEITVVSDYKEKPLRTLLIDLNFSSEIQNHLLSKLNEMLFGDEESEGVTSMGSPDAIYEFFSDLEELCVSLSKDTGMSSPMGLYMRKMYLAFQMMMFDGLPRLWEELCTYVDYSDPENGGYSGILSPFESEKFVNQQAEYIEKMIGTLSQQQIQEEIEKLKEIAPNLPKAHFLSYLNCVVHGEYEQAVENLHRYFDYAIESTQKESNLLFNLNNSNNNNVSVPKPKFHTLLPYATLNLAGLHFRFGHVKEGIQLIHETVRIAQERNDDECLALSLSWLFRLIALDGNSDVRDHHHQQEYQILKRCVARSAELNLPYLSSQSTLALANHYLLHPRDQPNVIQRGGETNVETHPTKVWELLKISTRIVTKELDQYYPIVSAAYLLRANCWDIFGNRDMSQLSLQMEIENSQQSSSSFSSSGNNDNNNAMCRLASHYSSLGEWETSIDILILAKRMFLLPPSQTIWKKITLQILCTWAVRRGQYRIGQFLSSQLEAISASDVQTDQHSMIDAKYRKAIVAMHCQNYQQATKSLHELNAYCLDQGMEIHSAGVKLTLAEIEVRSGNYVEALPSVLSCLTLCERYHLDSLQAKAKILLGEIQLSLQENAEKVEQQLSDIIPLVLQHCDIETVAHGYYVLALASISREEFSRALELLDQAEEKLKQIHYLDKLSQVYYLKARIHHFLNHKDSSRYASLFKRTEQSKAEASQFWSQYYYALDLEKIRDLHVIKNTEVQPQQHQPNRIVVNKPNQAL